MAAFMNWGSFRQKKHKPHTFYYNGLRNFVLFSWPVGTLQGD